jgi:energy-coupling factor transporter ATP-binding protein EcfA2
MTTVNFALGLGSYDSEKAVKTLPAQLELLRTFRDLARSDVALVYRLSTHLEPEGDVHARFKVLCVSRTDEALSQPEARSLLDQASVTFLSAWGITHLRTEPAIPRAKFRLRLHPDGCATGAVPIKPDWSPLVDLLRRRDEPIVVDLSCLVSEVALTGVSPFVPQGVRSGSTEAEGIAAEFFAAVAHMPMGNSSAALALHLTVHSDSPVDELVARTIGRLSLGLPVRASLIRRNVLFPNELAACSVLGRPEEVIRAFHPPYGHIQGRGLSDTRTLERPLRFRVPTTNGTVLGEATRQGVRGDDRVPVSLQPRDRLKHLYVLGKTGSGKTTLLKNLVRQDIIAGNGVAVIDPHGDLVDYALRHTGDRLDEVTLLDFSDPHYLPVLNPLLTDVDSPRTQDLVIEELIDIIVRRSFNQFTGPVFDDTVTAMLASIASDVVIRHCTPSIAGAVELLRHDKARQWIMRELHGSNPILSQTWATFNKMLGHDQAENVRWVLSKFSDFAPDGVLYSVTGGPRTDLSFTKAFTGREILLVKIPESVIGGSAAGLIGALTFARLHRAALSRPPSTSQPFYLYVDEFQKFVSADVEGLVAEARKFNLALTLANQNLRQLDGFSRFEGSSSSRLREALFSNVGTMVSMRIAGSDVQQLAQEFGLPEAEMRRIKQYEGLARAVIGGIEQEPFTLTVEEAEKAHEGDVNAAREVRKLMRKRGYWMSRTTLTKRVDRSIAVLRSLWQAPSSRLATPTPTRRATQSATDSKQILAKLTSGPVRVGSSRRLVPPRQSNGNPPQEQEADDELK